MNEIEKLKDKISQLEKELADSKNELTELENDLNQTVHSHENEQVKNDINIKEHFYKYIFDFLVEGVVFINSHGEVEIINEGAKQISKASFVELRDFVRDSRIKVLDENYNPFPIQQQPSIVAFQSKIPVKNTQLGVPVNDQYSWLLVNAQPVFDPQNEFLGVVSSFIDITNLKLQRDELRQAKMQLQISENSLKKAQEISHVGNWIRHIKTGTMEYSDEFLRIYDVPKEIDYDKIQQFINDSVYFEDRDKFLKRNKLIRDQKDTDPIEYRIQLHTGNIRTLWSSVGSTIFDEEGKPDILVGVVIDISEQKRLEERKLFEQTNQQTLRLESLRFLAGGIAHDFNNLLGGIYGYIDLAFNASNDLTVKKYLSNSLKSMDRAKSLTNQLITFTKSGIPNKSAIKIDKLLVDTTKFVLSGRSIICEFSISEDLWYCAVDKGQIGQVIENIVLNAVQALNNNGKLHVSAENVVLNSKKFVKLGIQDTGSGMSEGTLEHIFEPFFTTKKEGHGLGLATSYSIVKNHEGSINVESTLNEGTIFSIFLPATEKNDVPGDKKRSFNHKGQGVILVLDDEEDIRTIIRLNLESFGYEVITKKSGLEILEVVNQAEITGNLKSIFLDLTVPGGLGGKELIKELRKKFSVLPIFVISGYSEDPIIIKPQDYGFTGSLKKPFTKKDLDLLLNKYVQD